MYIFNFILAVLMLLNSETVRGSPPNWAKTDTMKRQGNMLYVVCFGSGPSLDLARSDAQRSCKMTASEQMMREFSASTTMYSTNEDVAVHREINEKIHVSGLVCVPRQESIDRVGETFEVWIKCVFDITKVKQESTQPTESKGGIINIGDLNKKLTNSTTEPTASYQVSNEKRRLNISTIPKCSVILITGPKTRIVKCESNPMVIFIEKEDQKIVIKAKGFLPKILELSGGLSSDTTIQIDFE